ncbi:hypothetical protein [Thiocapsa sp.]|uniref:hypothetical protein n=1 Tax=Thiocapsa sp. TaxID=2024551 RepID=UPI003593F211
MPNAGTESAPPRQKYRVTVEKSNQVWDCAIGGCAASECTALLILHSAPGVPHDHLENLKALASRPAAGDPLRQTRLRALGSAG